MKWVLLIILFTGVSDGGVYVHQTGDYATQERCTEVAAKMTLPYRGTLMCVPQQ